MWDPEISYPFCDVKTSLREVQNLHGGPKGYVSSSVSLGTTYPLGMSYANVSLGVDPRGRPHLRSILGHVLCKVNFVFPQR